MKTHIQLNDEFKIAKLEKSVVKLKRELSEANLKLINHPLDVRDWHLCRRMNTHFAEMENKREQEYRKAGYLKKIIGVSHNPGVNNLIDIHAYFHDESKEPDKILERKLKRMNRGFNFCIAALVLVGLFLIVAGSGLI